jgi:hypothetical protein
MRKPADAGAACVGGVRLADLRLRMAGPLLSKSNSAFLQADISILPVCHVP